MFGASDRLHSTWDTQYNSIGKSCPIAVLVQKRHTNLHTHMYPHLHTHMHTHLHTPAHTNMHIHLQHAHIHTLAGTHAHKLVKSWHTFIFIDVVEL